MTKKWSDVAASPAFQALTLDEQEEARQQYFDEVVAPQVGEDEIDSVREMFDADTMLRERSAGPSRRLGARNPSPLVRRDRSLTMPGDPRRPRPESVNLENAKQTATIAARLPGNVLKSTVGAAKEMGAGVAEGMANIDARMASAAAEGYESAAARAEDPRLKRQAAAAAGEATERAFESEMRQGRMARVGRRARAEQEAAIPEDAGWGERAIQSGLSSAMISLPAILAAGPAGGATVLGAGAGAARYSELKQLGLEDGQAAYSGALLGALETLTEYFPGKALVKDAPGLWNRVSEFMATELPGENINTIAQIVDDYRLQLREDVTFDDVVTAMRDTTAATVVGGGAQVGTAHALNAGLSRPAPAAMNDRGPSMPAPMPPPEIAPGALSAGVTNHTPPDSLSAQMGLTPVVVPNISPQAREEAAREFGFDKLQETPNVGPTDATAAVTRQGSPGAGADAAGGLVVPGSAPAGEWPAAAGPSAPVVAEREDGAVPSEAGQQAAPVETWFGRRGDGYVTEGDAQQALPGRQKRNPELRWAIEQMPSGKYRLAGYAAQAPAKMAVPPEIARKEIDTAAHNAATSPTNDLPEPTDAQKEAGNYRKGHLRVQGLDVTIENPQGSVRRSKADAKEPWEVTMPAHYGYIRGTKGADGDHIDVTLGPDPQNESLPVFVFDQANQGGGFDEHKLFVGFESEAAARKTYRESFAGDFGKKMEASLIGVQTASSTELKQWLESGDHSIPATQSFTSVKQSPSSTVDEGMTRGETSVTETAQAVETEAQGSQAPATIAADVGAAAEGQAATELSDRELQRLKLAPPAPFRILDQFDSVLRRRIGAEISIVQPADMTPQQRIASAVARMFNRSLTVVRQESGDKPIPNGMINRYGGQHIIVASDADDVPLSIAMHEIYHTIPEGKRRALNAALLELTREEERAEIATKFGYEESIQDEEIPAMIAQAITKREDFWQALRAKIGNGEFADLAKIILDKLSELIRGFDREYGEDFIKRYVTDIARARDLLSAAYADALREAAPQIEEQEAVAFSRRKEKVGDFEVEIGKDGSLTIDGDIEQIRAMLPEDIKGRITKDGMKFTTSDAPRVRAALAGRKVAYGRAGESLERLPMKDGKYVGAPDKFNTPAKVPHLRKLLRQLALEGEPGKLWYENSSEEVLRMVGGNIHEARKFAALLAIYSPQAKVDTNATFALRAWAQYKAGQPISVKTKVMDRKATEALSDVDAFWGGEKTGNFVTNLLRRIDPSLEQGATIDMWMMRAAQYKNDAPTATQYAFMGNEVNRLARDLDWEPQQVQAAIWVAMKARMQNADVVKRTEAKSEKRGWIRFERVTDESGKPKKVRKILNAAAHRQNWLDHAFAHKPSEKDTSAAKFDFGDGLRRHIGQVSFEARPGRTTGALPGIHSAPYALQVQFQQDVQKALYDKDGVDLLAQRLGLLVDSEVIAPGVWQGEVSPSSQKSVAMAPGKGRESGSIDPSQRTALDVYASVLGLLTRQEGVGWHRPFAAKNKSEANGLDIRLGRTLHPQEAADLEKAVSAWLSERGRNPADLAFISAPTGIRLVNFGAVTNEELRKDIFAVADSVLPSFEAVGFKSDGGMPTNDWKENPNGQEYVQGISAAGRSDVLEWARSVLAPRVQSVFERYAKEQGWGEPGEIRFSNRLREQDGGARPQVAPVFYSALTRAAESSSLTKAPAPQWLATLRNTKGVKDEEMQWVGLGDWLMSLGRQATKQEVVDYLRAHEIQVEDVVKGGVSHSKAQQEHDEIVVELTSLGFSPDRPDGMNGEFGMEGPNGSRWALENWDWVDSNGTPVRNRRVADLATRLWELRTAMADANNGGDFYEAADDETRYSKYTMPGGANYRELLLTLPSAGNDHRAIELRRIANTRGMTDKERDELIEIEKDERESYRSSHWSEPNIIAHIRFDERTDADGKRVLFIEEIQSDWHQQGRKKGYREATKPITITEIAEGEFEFNVTFSDGLKSRVGKGVIGSSASDSDVRDYFKNILAERNKDQEDKQFSKVPDAPFKTTWPELAFKRVLRWAAESGFDRVAWTTGEQQAERYNLRNVVETVEFTIEGESDVGRLAAFTKGGKQAIGETVSKGKLEDYIGKEAAERLLASEPETITSRGVSVSTYSLNGEQLEVGGEGMIGFYDNILPKTVAKLVKRWGGKVGRTTVNKAPPPVIFKRNDGNRSVYGPREDLIEVHSLDITPAMREAALGGLPAFSNRMVAREVQDDTGKWRPIENSNGQKIAETVQQQRNFWRWFGDSKVVDEQGRPLVVYHGTNEDFAEFNKDTRSSFSFFTSNPVIASEYADENMDSGNVMPVHLSMQKPYEVDAAGAQWHNIPDPTAKGERITIGQLARWAFTRGGYDGVIVRNVIDTPSMEDETQIPVDVFVPKRSSQVKSAIGNSGAFDPDSADIRFSNRQAPPWRRPWIFERDELGRFRFAAGARAYRIVADIANVVLDKVKLKPISTDLSRAIRRMRTEINKAKELSAEVAGKLQTLTPEEREMISDVIEGELRAGVTPPEKVLAIAANMQHIMSQQTSELVRLGMISEEAANRWEGKYLPRFYQKQFKDELKAWAQAAKQLLGRKGAMQGIRGNSLKARGLFKDIPVEELPIYEQNGWQVRDPKFDPKTSDEVTVWRDFTRQERDQMNEIRDSMFRFVMGYMRSQKDIALGRLYEHIANTMSSRGPKDGYVMVPDTSIEGTTAKKYGKLAGKWVPREVMDHLKAADTSDMNELFKMYLKGLSAWKEGRVVLNPVSHVNNIVSNVTLAHMAGVSYWDAHKYAGAVRDLMKGSKLVTEAKEAGLFGGTFSQADLMKDMPEQLKVLAGMAESAAEKNAGRVWNALSFWLRKPMGKAYEAEDLFFRYLIYRDARSRGLSPEAAIEFSQEFIFTYDDLPQGARALRDTVVPFFSWTYKAVPALARTAFEYPWRFAAPAAVLYGANTAMYAMAQAFADGDDDDSWWEIMARYVTDPEFRARARELQELERKDLPPWNKGKTAIGTPKVVRMWEDDVTQLPMFLDVSRLMPGGDMFDTENNAGGVPWPAPIEPGGPAINVLLGVFANLDYFRGKPITTEADTDLEAAEKRVSWLYQSMAPSIAPFGYHFNRAMNAVAYATDTTIDLGPVEYTGFGKDGLPTQPSLAALQTFGIKIRPIDLDQSRAIQESQRRRLVRDINAEISSLKRLRKNGAISDEAYAERYERAREKKARLRQGLTVEGDEEE